MQVYQPVRPHTSDFFPGFTIGGPDRRSVPEALWYIGLGLREAQRADHLVCRLTTPSSILMRDTLNYGPNGGFDSVQPELSTPTMAMPASMRRCRRRFASIGSWLVQGQREAGESLPIPDSVQGYYNVVTGCSGSGSSLTCSGNYIDPSTFSHTFGYTAPNMTLEYGRGHHVDQQPGIDHPVRLLLRELPRLRIPDQWRCISMGNSGASTTDTNGSHWHDALRRWPRATAISPVR